LDVAPCQKDKKSPCFLNLFYAVQHATASAVGMDCYENLKHIKTKTEQVRLLAVL
jgi:hypothetical protein